MPNYQLGKIYKIVSSQTDFVYVGSTTKKYLSQRLAKHNSDYKSWKIEKSRFISSFELLQYEDAIIVLLEAFPCNSKDKLRAREQHWINEFVGLCINKNKAYSTIEEIRKGKKIYQQENAEKIAESKKIYYQENIEIIKQRKKKYYQENAEIIVEKQKKYYQENTEIIAEKRKIYQQENSERIKECDRTKYLKNLEQIKQYRSEKIVCDCGGKYTKNHKSQHQKTQKHQLFINSQ